MLALTGLVFLLAAAGVARRGEAEFWLPIAFGAVVMLAYAGLTSIAAEVLSANS